MHYWFEADVVLLKNNSSSELYHLEDSKDINWKGIVEAMSFIKGGFGRCEICCADLCVGTIQRCVVFVLHC